MENLLGGKYKIERKIGSGSFGQLYSGIEVDIKGKVAIKLENVHTRNPLLPHEAEIYKHLQGGVGIPHLKWFGVERGLNIMVIDRLGPSLEDLFNYCDRKFTLKTVLMLASQMIDRIEFLHERGILHRDLKPDNFLLGINLEAYQIYIIDFGLGKKYKDSGTNTHIPYRENQNLIGTALYSSLNTHLGIEQSRRDDLESLGYMLMYFLRGSLPWESIKCTNKNQMFEKIKEKKMLTTIEELCNSYPPEFSLYFHYCRSLGFIEKPDYNYLKILFQKLFLQQGYQFDYIYSWITYIKKQHNGSTSGHERPPVQKPEGFTSSFRGLAQAIRCGGCGPSANMEVRKCKRDQALVANRRSTGKDCSNNNQKVNNLEHVTSANSCCKPSSQTRVSE